MIHPTVAAHLDSIDAGMAKRWMALAGRPSRHNANPEKTANLPKVKASELPGRQARLVKDGFKRDFTLKPDQRARHKIAPQADESTPMTEGPVSFTPGSRPGKLGKAPAHKGMKARDLRRAAAQLR